MTGVPLSLVSLGSMARRSCSLVDMANRDTAVESGPENTTVESTGTSSLRLQSIISRFNAYLSQPSFSCTGLPVVLGFRPNQLQICDEQSMSFAAARLNTLVRYSVRCNKNKDRVLVSRAPTPRAIPPVWSPKETLRFPNSRRLRYP
jgi:hypothetical protein